MAGFRGGRGLLLDDELLNDADGVLHGNRPAPPSAHNARPHECAGVGRCAHQRPSADRDQIDLNVAPARTGWIIAAVVVIGVLIAVLFAVGFLPRLGVNKELARDADAALHAAVPVTVVKPRRADAIMQVRLPGTLRPWQEVSIFARTTGYLAHFDVDISNQVKKGQLMAKIDSPEVDAQLRGAQAMLLQQQAAAAKAQTDLGLAQTTWKRFESLRGTSGVTQQELDQYQSNYNAAVSTLGVATANIAVATPRVETAAL